MRGLRNNPMSKGLMASVLVMLSLANGALADSATQIRLVCENHWPKLEKEQRHCRGAQAIAAGKLLTRIEAAPETSNEFSIAKTCIELAKIRQPAMIDWSRALACFQSRVEEPGQAKTETPDPEEKSKGS